MKWDEERYVRVYTRDTPPMLGMGWEARALFWEILRKADRAGALPLGKSGARGLAALTRIPQEVVERALPELLEDGCVEQSGTTLIVPNYIEAQEASMSPGHRQKESRERRRDMIRSGLDPDQRETVIYFIQSEHGGHVKIGRADDLAKRLQGLATGRPDKLILLGAVPGTLADERRVHAAFAAHRDKGEWFFPHEQVMAAARAAVTGATIEDVLRHGLSVTCHETSTVTLNRAVPGRAEPETTHTAGAPTREEPPPEPAEPPPRPSSPDPPASGPVPLAKLGPAVGAVVGELGALAEQLRDEGNGLGEAVCEKLAEGKMPTPKQLARLREIRDERARPMLPGVARGRAPPRPAISMQESAGEGQHKWGGWEDV